MRTCHEFGHGGTLGWREPVIRVLFVCMGNICRSPMAEGVFTSLAAAQGLKRRVAADSAGTHGYHIGQAPDPRAQEVAAARGIDLAAMRARKIRRADFTKFDFLLAMDRANFDHMASLAPKGADGRLGLLVDYAPKLAADEVPDPYYGARDGFEDVFDIVDTGVRGLLAAIIGDHL